MTVFDGLVGQEPVVAVLRDAVADAARVLRGETGRSMTHAWLFTGPPGSGRSVAARAFAAALLCPEGGCGECRACRTVLAGTSADVSHVVPEGLSYGVREARELVAQAARAPMSDRWQVVLVEDADRLTEQALNVLLKSVEEPPPRAVWLLCAPSTEDVLPTIRSRCRHVVLRTPPDSAVADLLVRRDGADPAVAAFAARASQGHVGRARRLAGDGEAQRRRRDVLTLAFSVGTVPDCFRAAAALIEAAREEATALTADRDDAETEELRTALGATGKGAPRGSAGAFKELAARQKSRSTRAERDALDRALVDLAALYRDVLARQLAAGVPAVHGDLADRVARLADSTTPEATLRRIEVVMACRDALGANVNPLLAVESMALGLRAG